METCFYREKRTFTKYDRTHIIGYLNEKEATKQEEKEDGEKYYVNGYEYEGTERDGGTVMECEDATDYGEVANAIIRTKYSVSAELALQRHKADGEADTDEWAEYTTWCEYAKTTAKAWFNME
ncbi:MAG: hypothetical protein LUC88_07965 [Prevotella sp.]|nr:hypothetical protein [Prevotella sp.]